MSFAQFTENLGHIDVDLPKDMLKVSAVYMSLMYSHSSCPTYMYMHIYPALR